MWRVAVFMLAIWCLTITCYAQYGPQVRITSNGMQSSGVAVSETEILTVGHAFGAGSHVRLEFIGPEFSVIVPGKVVKTDMDRDLGLVTHRLQSVKWLKRSKIRSRSVMIKGFHGLDESMRTMRGNVLASGASGENGEPLLTVDCEAVPGLSGAGVLDTDGTDEFVVGIQSAGSKRTYCATNEQIEAFLAKQTNQ